jgi:hypothetical protein
MPTTPNDIVDFRVRNDGAKVVLLFLNKEGDEVLRFTLSWISGLRLLNETRMAVEFGLLALENKVRKKDR